MIQVECVGSTHCGNLLSDKNWYDGMARQAASETAECTVVRFTPG